jgi:methyltransferase-like protein
MQFSKLLSLIPKKELEFLSAETKVNHQVKKLSGAIMFKLILYSLLENNRSSLRVMEEYFSSAKFKILANTKLGSVKYNSISDRISTINSDFFERLFNLSFLKPAAKDL